MSRDIVKVDASTHEISCGGVEGALGHPVVYYSFDGVDEITCEYCSRIFTKKTVKRRVRKA